MTIETAANTSQRKISNGISLGKTESLFDSVGTLSAIDRTTGQCQILKLPQKKYKKKQDNWQKPENMMLTLQNIFLELSSLFFRES